MWLPPLTFSALLPCILALAEEPEAGKCSAIDELKMAAYGGGHGEGSFPKRLSDCGKENYSIFSGLNKRKFLECVEGMGLGDQCSKCFLKSAEYGSKNCKWACFFGSWCGKGCLDCVGKVNDETRKCAGVSVPQATSC